MGMYTLIFSTINFRGLAQFSETPTSPAIRIEILLSFSGPVSNPKTLELEQFGFSAPRLKRGTGEGGRSETFRILPLGWTFGVSPRTPADQAHPMSPGCHTIVAHLSTSRKKRGGRPLKLRACRCQTSRWGEDDQFMVDFSREKPTYEECGIPVVEIENICKSTDKSMKLDLSVQDFTRLHFHRVAGSFAPGKIHFLGPRLPKKVHADPNGSVRREL